MKPLVTACALLTLAAPPAAAELYVEGEIRMGVVHDSSGRFGTDRDGATTRPAFETELTIGTEITTDRGLTIGAGVTLEGSTLNQRFRGRDSGLRGQEFFIRQ